MQKKFRTKYDDRKVFKSFRKVVSLTDQQYKNDTTVEGIVKRYGVLPRPEVAPVGLDTTLIGDFAESMQIYLDGVSAFESMPSDIRARFGNSPRAFYDFLHDPQNHAEAVRLGLMVKREVKPDIVDVLQDIAKNTSVTSGKEAALSTQGAGSGENT